MWGYLGGAHDATGEDFRRAKQLIGTSAGSIVAARLAGGEDPRRGEERVRWDGESEPEQRPGALRMAIERASRVSLGAFSPLAAPALSAASPAGALARAAVLARVPRGRIALDDLRSRVDALGPSFDGRLRLVAVDRGSGRRVVFGDDGAPEASVADAVAASCAVPGLFAPVLDRRPRVRGRRRLEPHEPRSGAGRERRPRALPRPDGRDGHRTGPRAAGARRGLADRHVRGGRGRRPAGRTGGDRGARWRLVSRHGHRPDESGSAGAGARRGLQAGSAGSPTIALNEGRVVQVRYRRIRHRHLDELPTSRRTPCCRAGLRVGRHAFAGPAV